jgi:hypothetical protein
MALRTSQGGVCSQAQQNATGLGFISNLRTFDSYTKPIFHRDNVVFDLRGSYAVKIILLLCALFVAGNGLFGQTNPAPYVNQLAPISAKPGSGAFTLTVYGANFVSGSVLKWNGSARTTHFVSYDQLTAAITAADVSKASTASVTVVNPAPGGGVSNVATFSVQRPFSAMALAPTTQRLGPGLVAVGDFNGDGKLDLVIGESCDVYNCIASLDFYAGKGDGTFAPPVRTPVDLRLIGDGQTFVISLYVADYNADGIPDIAFNADSGDPEISAVGTIMLGNGDGTFTQLGSIENGSYQDNVVAAGDINQDSLPDLIATGGSGGGDGPEESIWLGIPGGQYTQSQYFDKLGEGGGALGDFNGDGKLDLVLSSETLPDKYTDVFVLSGNGGGTFQQPVDYVTSNPNYNVFIADLNGDGKLDIFTDGICTLFGNGNGTFALGPCTPAAQGPSVIGDFNADGKMDIAILSGTPPAINIYFGNGDGTFFSPFVYVLPTSPSYSIDPFNCCVLSLSAGDFTNDGRIGFAVSGTPTVAVYLPSVARVTPTAVAYGTVQLFGTVPPQTVTFQNIGKTILPITAVKVKGTDANLFTQTNNCGETLPAGGSCQIQVSFAPQKAGIRSAFLEIDYQGLGKQQTIPLSGTAIGSTTAP